MGKQWKQCQTIFWGSKIIADSDCSHEIKRHLLLGRKVMTNLNSILKSRDKKEVPFWPTPIPANCVQPALGIWYSCLHCGGVRDGQLLLY